MNIEIQLWNTGEMQKRTLYEARQKALHDYATAIGEAARTKAGWKGSRKTGWRGARKVGWKRPRSC